MKCPHCGKDIKTKLIVSEAARIAGRKSRRVLTSDDARATANIRWEKHRKETNAD